MTNLLLAGLPPIFSTEPIVNLVLVIAVCVAALTIFACVLWMLMLLVQFWRNRSGPVRPPGWESNDFDQR